MAWRVVREAVATVWRDRSRLRELKRTTEALKASNQTLRASMAESDTVNAERTANILQSVQGTVDLHADLSSVVKESIEANRAANEKLMKQSEGLDFQYLTKTIVGDLADQAKAGAFSEEPQSSQTPQQEEKAEDADLVSRVAAKIKKKQQQQK